MKPVFVCPDAHGNHELVAGLLRKAGILTHGLVRSELDCVSVQLGDLVNCVAASIDDDLHCLERAESFGWFDVYLVGNHEHPYFEGPGFTGFWRNPEIERRLLRLNASGLIRPCLAADGTLVSHAGLTSTMARTVGWATAAEAEADIVAMWRRDPTLPLFSTIGRSRGGWSADGGILWSDWAEPKWEAFRQVVGHTVGDEPRFRGRAICLDVGAGKGRRRIVGAWIRHTEPPERPSEPPELVEYVLGEENE